MKKIIPALFFSLFFTLSAAVADASIWTAREEGDYYELIYPVFECDDPVVKEAINADIYTRAARTADAARRNYTTSFRYELKMENNRYLSLVFFPGGYEEGAAHAMYTGVGVVYDKATGEKVPLSHFADVTTADLVRLYEAGAFHHYEGLPLPIDPVKRPTKVPEDYFITRWGTIFVLFDARELAPFQAGATAIDVTSLKHPGVSLPSV